MVFSKAAYEILAACIATSLVVEFLSWALVFRRKAFKTTKNEVLILSARIDALKQQGKGESDKNVKRLTQDQTKHQVNLSIFRFQTMTIQLVLIGVIWRALSRSYKGVPVAKLPFVPFKFFERLTHSGLPGEDPTDLAFHGLYVLCSAAVRGMVSKLVNKQETELLITHGTKNLMEKFTEEKKD